MKPSNLTRSERRRRQKERERALRASPDFEVQQPPSTDYTAEELIAMRLETFRRKREHEEARREINVKVNLSGPIGILHFGDPHLDDDGCNWEALTRDVELVRNTNGLFAANIGDTENNWVGRLAHLWNQQSTTAAQSKTLARWLFEKLGKKWLYIIAGNHDLWTGEGDALHFVAEQIGALYESSEARLKLNFPNGVSATVNARHDFSGGSIYNPAHGPMKAGQFGVRDDILICGHKHKSGYGVLKDPDSGRVCHCIQVASYKVYDRYAREKGFRDQHISPCCVTIIDPQSMTPEGFIQVFWDARKGAEYLKFLRGE